MDPEDVAVHKKTTGAWLVHHTNKLGQFQNTVAYDHIENAGRTGILLAVLTEGAESEVDDTRVTALAQANGITTRELPYLLDLLQKQRLIDRDVGKLRVLGVTLDAVLEHTADIFELQEPTNEERATLALAEQVSHVPLTHQEAVERLGDLSNVSNPDDLLRDMADMGLVDTEEARRERLYFNGNLFKRDAITKAQGLLSTLSAAERTALSNADALIAQHGCVPWGDLERVLGKELFDKIGPLGVYDLHEVANEQGKTYFVTKPAAFKKFSPGHTDSGDAFVDDALDHAKSLVACLTFGMTCRNSSEGRITQIGALLRKLIGGSEVGPATAIGRDYQVLEYRGVVRIRPYQGDRFFMRLLKPDVGKLALNVLTTGDTSHESLPQFPGAAVTGYAAPETNREIARKKSNPLNKQQAHRILHTLRTGGGPR